MSSATTSEQPTLQRPSRASLWFGLIGGGLAWTLHLMAAYAIAEFGCVSGMGERTMAGISLVAWMELAATVLTAGLAAIATAVAYRLQRRSLDHDRSGLGHIGEQATARAGLLASGFFTFVILFESIPILFYLRDC